MVLCTENFHLNSKICWRHNYHYSKFTLLNHKISVKAWLFIWYIWELIVILLWSGLHQKHNFLSIDILQSIYAAMIFSNTCIDSLANFATSVAVPFAYRVNGGAVGADGDRAIMIYVNDEHQSISSRGPATYLRAWNFENDRKPFRLCQSWRRELYACT